jgi:hypothetical protein
MLVGTKQDIRKGKNTGSPVSGCIVESTTIDNLLVSESKKI